MVLICSFVMFRCCILQEYKDTLLHFSLFCGVKMISFYMAIQNLGGISLESVCSPLEAGQSQKLYGLVVNIIFVVK